MEDLKELIIQTLDAQGVLDKIRAQLRLQVFKAVQNDEGKMQNENSKPVKMAQSPEGLLAVELLRDFLECYKMKYSLNVLVPEFHLSQTQDVRAFLTKELKFTPEPGEPFLAYILKFLMKDGEGSNDFKKKEEVKEPKLLGNLPDIKGKNESKIPEKKPLAQIPEFKAKPVEEKPPEKKTLAQIPEFKAKPVEEKPPEKKNLAQIPEFKGKSVEEKKPLAQIPDFKGKVLEEKKNSAPVVDVKAKPVEDKPVEKKPLAQIPDFKGKAEEKPAEKKPLSQIPDFKGKPEEKSLEKKPLAQIPDFKGKPEEKPLEKKPLAQIPDFKGKPQEKPSEKPQEKKPLAQIPDFKGKPEEKKAPSNIPEFKGKVTEEKKPLAQIPDFKGKQSEDPKRQIDPKGKKVEENKGKVPNILLPDIDSPESSERFEDSNDKEAIADVKKRLQNYGNYMDELGEDVSSKKFEFDNYEQSGSYEENSEDYYQDLSDDPSMHSEFLDDYDIVQDAEYVETDEEEEGSSNS
jgi:hypothetical protein